jgi:uncharacterized membrane protein YdbT with pleckstrin-like domain
MSSVSNNLLANEEVVAQSSKHWFAPVRASLVALALLAVAGVITWLLPSGTGLLAPLWTLVGWIRWGLVIAGVAWIIYNVVAWRTAEYAVTNLRVLRYEGLLQKRSSETLLSAVSDVKLRVGLIGSKLDYGDLRIFTTSGAAGADEFNLITAPAAFRNAMMNLKVEEQMAQRRTAPRLVEAQAPAPAVLAPVARADDSAASLVALADLRDRGVISDSEFEAKKTEILARL